MIIRKRGFGACTVKKGSQVSRPQPGCHYQTSVSRFQEKEKGVEMITINDNKNDNIK
jgi:hypothetical protein